MVGELVIIGGLGVIYYLIQKKKVKEKIKINTFKEIRNDSLIPEHQLTKAEKLSELLSPITIARERRKLIEEAEIADVERIRLRNLEAIRQQEAVDAIIEQSKNIAADTSYSDAYRSDAAKFVEQERLRVEAAAAAVMAAAAKVAAAAKEAARKLNLETIIEQSKNIATNISYSADYRSDAAKFAHQEQRRKEGWTKAEWQKEWRDMLNV